MIPDGWKRKSLGEIADISSGSTPSRQKDKYWNGTIPWVTTGEIDYQIIKSTKERITELACKECSLKIHRSGTILMAMYGQGMTRGRIALLGINATTNQACCAIRLDSSANTKFIYFQLEHLYPEIRKLGHGGNQQNLNGQIIKQISITYPPLPEQCKIAEILGAWDDAIALLEKLITAKRKLKQGLMQQLLTDKKRFKEFEGSEWETVRLRDITTINYGKSPKNIFSREGQFPVYGTGGITGYTSTHIYDGESVIIGRKGTIDKVRYVSGKFWAIDTTYYLEFRQIVKAKWIYYFLSFTKLELLNEASGVPSLNRDTLYSIKINLPSLPEQEKIAAVLSATDTEISNLEKQLAAYKQQKRGLMQQLLTGKTRVRVN
jgi:type I restriction enzyme, S subunit